MVGTKALIMNNVMRNPTSDGIIKFTDTANDYANVRI